MATLATQKTHAPAAFRLEPEGRRTAFDKLYLGFVKNITDGAFMGRIKVFVPELCGADEEDETTWIICDYVAPFGGRGHGMWALPRVGDQVVITFINGDPNRGVWLGSMYAVDQHASVPNGPTQGSGVTVQDRDLIQPVQYSDPRPACQAVPSIHVTPPQRPNNPDDPLQADIQTSAGTHLSPETRPTNFSSNNSYLVTGIRTPAGNHVTLSDQQGAAEVRLATFNGMQIILNAQSGTITILGKQAHSRIELTQDGNINVYGKGNLSMRAQGDINLHADQNLNIQAGEKINMRSGGNTHMESVQAIHIKSNTNMHLTSLGEHHRVSNGNLYDTTAQSYYTHANYGVTTSARAGNITLKSFEGNMYLTVADGTLDQSAKKAVHVHATEGDVHVKSQNSMYLDAQQHMHVLSQEGKLILTCESNFDVRSNNGELKLFASQGVFVGEQTAINSGVAQSASSATQADTADTGTGAIAATAAKGPEVREHPTQTSLPAGVGDLVGAAVRRQNSVITSVGSYVPAGEVTNNRYQSGPGYSNTLTVVRDNTCTKDYKVGQVEFNQLVPLTVYGYIRGEQTERPQRFIGEGYEENGTPRYRAEDIANGVMKPASGYTGEYEGLSETAFRKIQDLETLTGPWPTDRRMQPFHNACARSSSDSADEPPSGVPGWIGYGHKLTESELQEGLILIEGNQVSFDSLTEEWFIRLLKQDVTPVVTEVKGALGDNLVTQQQLDALVDFAWNVGVAQFKESGIIDLINNKRYDEVPNEIIAWSSACGAIRAPLLSRRLFNCYAWSGTQRTDSPVQLASLSNVRASATSQGARAQQAFDFFVSQGWTREQSAGIVGNLIQESNLNPAALNIRENAQGIAQWTPTGGRQARVAAFLGKPVLQATFEEQLRAIQWELSTVERSAAQRLRSAQTVDQATAIVDRYYERSAGTELLPRIAHARALLARQI